ncbi:MAG TPA: hypothetical protein VIC85_09855 [Ktedonobacterales bacterium]
MSGPLPAPDGGLAAGLVDPPAVTVLVAPPFDPLWFTNEEPDVPDPPGHGLAQAAIAVSSPIRNKATVPRSSAERLLLSPPGCEFLTCTHRATHGTRRSVRDAAPCQPEWSRRLDSLADCGRAVNFAGDSAMSR